MRTPALLIFTGFSLLGAHAQTVQWLTGSPLGFNINPELPQHLVCAADDGHVYVARTSTLSYLYGSPVYGTAVVEQRDAQGAVAWSIELGDSVLLQAMAADANGRLVLGGRFFRQVHLGNGGLIPAVNGNEFPETFLLALDIDGGLLWQRNIAPPDPQGTDVQSITFDQIGRAWYATCDFLRADIKRLDDEGNDVETRPLENAKTIGAISFDPWGGLYVSGATGDPGITVNGTFFPMGTTYRMFVLRMQQDGSAQWLSSADDVTFQRPLVAADASGHAYLAGSPFDSLTFGNLHFHGPEWNSTCFLARLDSTGLFQWGFQPPQGAPFTGQFSLAGNASLGVSGNGDALLLGTTNGMVDWGNGVVTEAGTIQDRAVTVLAMASNGMPQWEVHGGSADMDVPQGLSVLPNGICHLAVQVRDTFQFGPFVLDTTVPELAVARIAPTGSAGIYPPVAMPELSAWPSPFTSTFSIAGLNPGMPVRVVIQDPSGRVVDINNFAHDLGGSLVRGMYVVTVEQGGYRWHTRVLKQ
ncbi:MAG: T9SS type A sorting domain-containing protein [Bacteroidetes bacterium]|nr:T9SS type A sorting domain-containing protein [Bacteroidota bacterium]MBS1940962.1 T9SS type A sorting domain-containing protein [Bacteroidota bacterium]